MFRELRCWVFADVGLARAGGILQLGTRLALRRGGLAAGVGSRHCRDCRIGIDILDVLDVLKRGIREMKYEMIW